MLLPSQRAETIVEVERILGQPDLPAGPQSALVSLQDEIARLDRITEPLLQLARFDAGQIVLNKAPLQYSRLLEEACEDAELLASAAKVTLDFASIRRHGSQFSIYDPSTKGR